MATRLIYPTGVSDEERQAISIAKEILQADRTYYVRLDGNDSNDGLTDNAGGAFLTIQKGVDAALTVDPGDFQVTIKVRVGVHNITSSIDLKPIYFGTKIPILEGDVATNPSLTTISSNGSDLGETGVLNVTGRWIVRGISITHDGTTTSSHGFSVKNQGYLRITDIRVNQVDGAVYYAVDNSLLDASDTDLTHLGDIDKLVFCNRNSTVNLKNSNITYGPINIDTTVCETLLGSIIDHSDVSISGSITSSPVRDVISGNSVLDITNSSVLPGTIGSPTFGGVLIT